MSKAMIHEMEEEAILRLELLHAPIELLERLREDFKIKVTLFTVELGDVEEIHQKALNMFRKAVEGKQFPFYITESWHGVDVISVLYIGDEKDDWEHERTMARMGYHAIFGYNPGCEELSKLGDGCFDIEDGLLWRVG